MDKPRPLLVGNGMASSPRTQSWKRMRAGRGRGKACCLLSLLLQVALCLAATDPGDLAALQAVKARLTDPNNKLANWVGDDPCNAPWEGVFCTTDAAGMSRVVELRLFRMGLQGTLAPEIGNLVQLTTLNVMWNEITGGLPSSVGNLTNLFLLLVNGNKMSGPLPPELGYLSGLNRIQIDQNNFSGPLPATFSNLRSIQHLHMNNNSLAGPIPPFLGSLPNLVHILLDNNQITGDIPSDIGNSPSLLILQLDNNPLSPQPIPPPVAAIPTLLKLSLRNCNLQGRVPPISSMPSLKVLDVSHNNLTGTLPNSSFLVNLTAASFSSNALSQDMTRLVLGPLPSLQSLLLANNRLQGTANASRLLGFTGGAAGSPVSSAPQPNTSIIIDLQNNSLSNFEAPPAGVTLRLAGNTNPRVCPITASRFTECTPRGEDESDLEGAVNHGEAAPDCLGIECPAKFSAPQLVNDICSCLYPVSVVQRLKSPGFTIFAPFRTNYTIYFAAAISEATNNTVPLSWDQVAVRDFTWEPGPRLRLDLQLFPSGPEHQFFTMEQVNSLLFVFSNWKLPDNAWFGPYEFIDWDAGYYASQNGTAGAKGGGLSAGAVVGIVVGAVAVTAVVVGLVGLWFFRNKKVPPALQRVLLTRRRRESGFGSQYKLNISGVREFTFDELCVATDYFSDDRKLGQGGYGKVFRGELEIEVPDDVSGLHGHHQEQDENAAECLVRAKDEKGQAQVRPHRDGQGGGGKDGAEGENVRVTKTRVVSVAIKRAEEGSLQGSREFYTEIELLSRVHHRNLVGLIGYCDDKGEQMLVYEYMQGGTLRDNLSAASHGGVPELDFPTRLRIALGSARGIAYLHNEASPPIFHRDIKASNILLDGKRNAKVADFGLSKLAPAPEQEGSGPGHVSTVVKGTPGYLDPEYFLTHKLTDKSDVYSFGVVLLELVTGMHPITQGKNIVREVKAAYQAGTLGSVLDPCLAEYPAQMFEPMARLALACCLDNPDGRPTILEVVRDLEDMWHTMPWAFAENVSVDSGVHSYHYKQTPDHGAPGTDSEPSTNVLLSGTQVDVTPR